MSESGQGEPWFVGEDGCLSVKGQIQNVVFHPSLNVILVTTQEATVHVVDVTSGAVFHSSDLSVDPGSSIRCIYLASQDRMVFTSDFAVGTRQAMNGMLLLESALQLPVTKQEDIVCVELPLPDAIHLNQCLLGADLPGVDHVMDVLRLLDKEIAVAQELAKHNHKLAKWSTICLKMSYASLKTVFSSLLNEMKRLQQKVPALPIVSALLDRLNYLLVSLQSDSTPVISGVGAGTADRTLMYSESARLETFAKWPHLDYKWALPEPMAQAGFYYQPSSAGDDRAMCFTCNVCLVCWEPTDEPWSEHERHSPQCPFVKGEFTQNVPVSVTYATEPAQLHGDRSQKITCLSTSASTRFFATSNANGNIIVWNTSHQLKKHLKFDIDLQNPIIASKIGSISPSVISKPAVAAAVADDTQDQSSDQSSLASQAESSTCKVTVESSEVHGMETSTATCRTDFSSASASMVTSLSVIVGVPSEQGTSQLSMASIPRAGQDLTDIHPSLVAGIFVRVHSSRRDQASWSSSVTSWQTDRSKFSEVQVLNQLNQAISGETPQIISTAGINLNSSIADKGIKSTTENGENAPDHFIPCLVVYDILASVQTGTTGREPKSEPTTFQGTQVQNTEFNDNIGTAVQSVYSMKDIDMSDDDQDIQIIGVTGVSPVAPKILSLTYDSVQGTSYGVVGGSQYHQSKDMKIKETEIGKSFHSDSCAVGGGNMVQCITLPATIDSAQYVRCIVPVPDKSHIIVVTSPFSVMKDEDRFHKDMVKHEDCCSCMLIYQVVVESNTTHLNPVPVVVAEFNELDNAIMTANCLPPEVCLLSEDDDEDDTGYETPLGYRTDALNGAVAITTYSGDIKILNLRDLSLLAVIKGTAHEAYISTTYCSSIDRLCACTRDGRLRFFVVGPKQRHLDELDGGQPSLGDFSIDGDGLLPAADDQKTGLRRDSFLVNDLLTVEVLTALRDLTQFENLLPRFSATVPPCWNEIQQEQQQRKHPQHLHQQGEAMQHTRTWRMQSDSTSWDEHLFELILPRLLCIGHIDLKFTLNPMCTCVPNIQVTLLRQSVSGIGQSLSSTESTPKSSDADARINFSLPSAFSPSFASDDTATGCLEDEFGGAVSLGSEFLERHRSDIVCGPLDLVNYVDLSGTQGVIPLTSIRLLKCKSKSFLLHIKSRIPKDKGSEKPTQSSGKVMSETVKSKPPAVSGKQTTSITTSVQNSSDRSASTSKQKVDNIRGCDWLQEVSITVRRFRKSSQHNDRALRYAMLESVDFHVRLLLAACGQDDISAVGGSISKEHRQHLALDILTWIMAIQINDASKMQLQGSSLMQTLQSNLLALIQSCLIEGDRSVAHKCAKLIALCLEYVKSCIDPDVAPGFNFALLQALLECMPHILNSFSAGALHWYFTLLNHVKCMDANAAGEKCMMLLSEIAKSYSCRVNPYHSLLRARYGLYGVPLEPDLFDIEPPQLRTAPATSNSYAGVVASSVGVTGSGISAGGIPINAGSGGSVGCISSGSGAGGTLGFSEDVIFKDLMNLCHSDRSIWGSSGALSIGSASKDGTEQPLSRYLTGLLEVEPLHFTCHATSDGTRMERMDTLNQTTAVQGNPVSLSGTINFGEGLPSTTGTMLSSLSNAMVSAEQQLYQLQQKQLQLIKLQQQKQKLEQKLAETTKNVASGATVVSLPSHFMPYGSELFPPTPKNTPFFMTPPVTPPNESYHGIFMGGVGVGTTIENDKDSDNKKTNNSSKAALDKNDTNKQLAMLWPQAQTLFQPPPAQALVIDRMHSGARRFVVLDFGKAILLTDVVIPMCGDLASLSIDIWIQGEEIDGHRLVVSSDIGISSLIMNDIMPPPVCRYLKITTIRRYGGNTTRSKIPIGSFYGHSFILPWEKMSAASHLTPRGSDTSPGSSSEPHKSSSQTSFDQSQILSQLGMYMPLLEDIQCRYSLACKNLITLLSAAEVPGSESTNHTQFFLKKGRRTDDDNKIHQAYCECIQLQVQLNLAKHASTRLQKVLGIYNTPSVNFDISQGNFQVVLKQMPVDKLRVLIEFLLDTILSMTNSCPTIPQVPISLCNLLIPSYSEMLFRNLCIHGTKKMQTHAGIVLVRVCGTQSWWGEFLGNILQEFFTSEQATIFPQDRVFILLAALGQRSLTGPSASSILENILLLLARQLFPLVSDPNELRSSSSLRHLDLTLIGWLLLFLSKCLDCCQPNSTDDENKANKDKEGRWCIPGSLANRWNFIQGENAAQANKLSRSNTSKLYRRKLQKRLLHHKQQLINLQQAKKHFASKMEESVAAGNLLDKETEHLVKTQDMLFKRQIRLYSSKHLKDIINIRRTDGELLRKQNLKEGSGYQNGDRDAWENDLDSSQLVMSRDKCIPVVHGLVALLLSMDFTCHVDLFIIACKVLARVTLSTRPAISLSEAMKQDDLERLMLLMCNVEYNHGNVSWGGSWSGHSITCLLLDMLEGERLYSVAAQMDGVAEAEILTAACGSAAAADPTASADVDELLLPGCPLPTMDEEPTNNDTSGKAKYDVDMSMLVDAVMEDELYEEQMNPKYTDLKDFLYSDSVKGNWTTQFMNITAMKSNPNSSTIHWGFSGNPVFVDEDKRDLKLWKSKNANLLRPVNAAPQGVSLAMDSRLEQGVELKAELRLKLMLSMEANNIQNAMNAPLPLLTLGSFPKMASNAPSLPDERLSDDSFYSSASRMETPSSLTMLSTCFSNLFSQLHLRRINLDVLLQTWLTLNDETTSEENTGPTFDPSKIPSVALDQNSVSSLLAALAWSSSVSARTWVLAFQTLTLMANIKCSNDDGMTQVGVAESTSSISQYPEKWLASYIITDSNLMTVLVKFLSGSAQQTSLTPAVQNGHIGPVVVQSFHDLLVRLQLRCGHDAHRLKEVLLRLVLALSAEGGAFHLFLGPLDAQYRLIEDLCEMNFVCADVNTAISILESVAALVHRHIMSQERVQCRSTIENNINARSVYAGLFSNMLKTSENKSLTGDANQDLLICSLLRLASFLVKIPQPHRQAPKKAPMMNRGTAETDSDVGSGNVFDFSKINQVLGNSGIPNVSSISHNGVTDEQKTGTAWSATNASTSANATTPVTSLKRPKTCSHYVYSTTTNPEPKQATLADIVLGHRQIMLHLMEALACCNTNTVAMILASSGLRGGFKQDAFAGENPLSVGDGIFSILLTLNSQASEPSIVVKPVYEYLSSELHGFSQSVRVSRLSEPLLWFLLRVLDCHDAINIFLELGGIEVICQNLVSTNRHIIDTSPSLVSAIMQYFGTARPNGSLRRGAGGTDCTADSLQNFAPLGTITSVSPNFNPADVLIHGTAPHRRARSAAWTYHFYPDEAWVDLTISLPCAILLKEVNIQPHLTSLATCPAAVTVEGNRDGTHMVPICPPTSTSGLTNIKIQLLKEEVVTAVTIRLHKPRDSHTVGLAQIALMGYMAFGDTGAARTASVVTPPEDYVSRTSIGWLRLLHHCVTQCDDLQKDITQAAVSTPDLLVTCTTLLMTSSALIYANSIESVLLTIGLHSTEMGLSLLDHLLRNTSLSGLEDGGQSSPSFYNKLNGRANESTVDILYQLGTNQESGLMVRLKAFVEWLGDCARLAIHKSHAAFEDVFHRQGVLHPAPVSLVSPAVVHVHCIAAVLWYNNEMAVTDDLKEIVTKDLLSSMYEWSMSLANDSLLKQAVDSVICSLCYIHPHFFPLLLEWMGIVIFGGVESYTDDHKDSQQNLGPLTDDLKADSDYQPYVLPDIRHLVLEESHLSTLARACQSPVALRQLLDSGFVMMLCQSLCEVSSQEIRQHEDPIVVLSEASTDAVKMAMDSGSATNSYVPGRCKLFTDVQGSYPNMSSRLAAVIVTADTVAPVLRFLAELSQEVMMKDWLGGPDGRIFWSVLLKSLCASSSYVLVRPSHRAMTNEQRSAIETATINFFSKVISCHAENQLQFSQVLLDVIRSYDNSTRGCPTPLPGFLRRLFLQVLLEDEKLLVCISSQTQMYKGGPSGLPLTIQHPHFGVGHKYRTLTISLQTTCGEILSKISETQSLASSQSLEDQEKVVEEMKKDASELGIEVIDQISALAGFKAKEKRDKDALQRPPSRLGTRSGDRAATATQLPAMALYHSLIQGQPLPGELTISQLLSILYEKGVAHGQTYINLSMKHPTRAADDATDDRRIGNLETLPENMTDSGTSLIPTAVLLQAPNFTSALQVFSGIGGLALLAEHLPLLYPEFSRQTTPVEAAKEASVPGGIGHDWVTVESTEDIYEEIYEPAMPPSPPVQHKPTSIAATQVQSIPPHSLVAFGLFLRLPGYAEVLLKEKRKAQCLLRLVLGVTDDGEGGHILTSAIAPSLPSLPFNVLKSLFDSMPLTTDDGVMLRRKTLEIGAIHLILACLSVLGHHAPRQQIPGFYQDIIKAAMQVTQTVSSMTTQQKNTTEEKSQNYWAKGTGFGTGSTTSSWDAEHALLRQKSEEEHVTCLLQVLASYIHPAVTKSFVTVETNSYTDESDDDRSQTESCPLPPLLPELLSQSCLVPALSSYLRNDSVLDMACHVPLYRALLELLRAMALCPMLVPLLLPLDKDDESVASVSSLLEKMKQCVDTYASRLKGNRLKVKSNTKADDDESEGLALLIPDIQKTAQIVSAAVDKVTEKSDLEASDQRNCEPSLAMIGRMNHSEEERYMNIIKQLQFDTFKMVTDDNNVVQFAVPHHYESNVKAAGDNNNAARARRLAQEAVTLSTSLPLSASSSVFVRCDEERLDVMKVMMTGPADTPYGNGCFEFDVYFPTDYPNSPPLINLETTGNHTVRFNPNLYNDGKVCLSILNTWHGRPEEKWNSQTSSFLQVLVSIQSLILVSEPYFNEPGYERSRGTPSGTASSREYDANIRQATVKWAMLEMLRNPPACFKSVIQWHFWLKKNEILSQVEEWISDLESYSTDKRVGRSIAHSSAALKRHYNQLKEELLKLKPPTDTTSFSETPEPSDGTSIAPQTSAVVESDCSQTTPKNT